MVVGGTAGIRVGASGGIRVGASEGIRVGASEGIRVGGRMARFSNRGYCPRRFASVCGASG